MTCADSVHVWVSVDRELDRVYYFGWRVSLLTFTNRCIYFYVLREVYSLCAQAVNDCILIGFESIGRHLKVTSGRITQLLSEGKSIGPRSSPQVPRED